MPMSNLGKKFEEKVKEDWERIFPKTFFTRLPDQQSRYFGQSGNICDYIGFVNCKLFLMECKETKETTFNFKSNLGVGNVEKTKSKSQYERLLEHKDDENTYPGVLLWFSSFDKVVWLNIGEIERMVNDGLKSFNVKMIDNCNYNVYTIPATKLRTFMRCDFEIFRTIEKE